VPTGHQHADHRFSSILEKRDMAPRLLSNAQSPAHNEGAIPPHPVLKGATLDDQGVVEPLLQIRPDTPVPLGTCPKYILWTQAYCLNRPEPPNWFHPSGGRH
jgi:hypothetical protein